MQPNEERALVDNVTRMTELHTDVIEALGMIQRQLAELQDRVDKLESQ